MKRSNPIHHQELLSDCLSNFSTHYDSQWLNEFNMSGRRKLLDDLDVALTTSRPAVSHGTDGDGRGHRRKYVGVTEEAQALDVRRLQREGLLVPGNSFGIAWPGMATRYFRVPTSLNALHFAGATLGALPLTWTACTYGGARAWFLCPAHGCRRRVALLYGGPAFLCRHCRRLTFRSRRLDPRDRALSRARHLRVKLGGAPELTAALPPKPKGMHQWTYTRKGVAIISAELRASRATLALLGTKPAGDEGS